LHNPPTGRRKRLRYSRSRAPGLCCSRIVRRTRPARATSPVGSGWDRAASLSRSLPYRICLILRSVTVHGQHTTAKQCRPRGTGHRPDIDPSIEKTACASYESVVHRPRWTLGSGPATPRCVDAKIDVRLLFCLEFGRRSYLVSPWLLQRPESVVVVARCLVPFSGRKLDLRSRVF